MMVIGGMATYFIGAETALLKEELKKRVAALVENFSRNCDYPLLLEDGSAIEKLAGAMMRDEDVVLIRVNKADGRVLFLQSKEQIDNADLTEGRSGQNGCNRPCWKVSKRCSFPGPYGLPLNRISFSGHSPEKRPKNPLGRVTVGFSLKKTNALILQTVVTATLIAVAIAIVSILILMVFLGRFFDPLLVIAQGIRELSEGRLSHRLNIERTDEIGELAGAFNDMAEALEGSRKRLEEVHQTLEETVRKRTEALRDSETRYGPSSNRPVRRW